jgi:hypothetical protein
MGAHILRCVAGLGQISAASSDGRYSWEKERERGIMIMVNLEVGLGGIISDGVACCAHGSHRDAHIYSSCTPR